MDDSTGPKAGKHLSFKVFHRDIDATAPDMGCLLQTNRNMIRVNWT
jgi:hypothetical protein